MQRFLITSNIIKNYNNSLFTVNGCLNANRYFKTKSIFKDIQKEKTTENEKVENYDDIDNRTRSRRVLKESFNNKGDERKRGVVNKLNNNSSSRRPHRKSFSNEDVIIDQYKESQDRKMGTKYGWKSNNIDNNNNYNNNNKYNDDYDDITKNKRDRKNNNISTRTPMNGSATMKTDRNRLKSEVTDRDYDEESGNSNEEMNITGFRSVLSAFINRDPNDIKRLYINHSKYEQNKAELRDIVKYFSEAKKPYRLFQDDDKQMEKVSQSKHHEGICLVVKPLSPLTIEQALQREFSRTRTNVTPSPSHSSFTRKNIATGGNNNQMMSVVGRPVVVLLDNVENPHNIGAIARASASFGVKTIFAFNENENNAGGRVNPLSTASYRSSRGAMEHIDVVPIEVRSDAINMIKEFIAQGWQVVTTSGDRSEKSVALYSDRAIRMLGANPLLLVFGSESEGVSKGIVKLATNSLVIPNTGAVDCLNVSQALSIVLAECWRLQGRSLEDQRAGKPDLLTRIKNKKTENLEITPELLGISKEDIYRDLDDTQETLDEAEDIELQEELKDYDEMKRNKKSRQ